MAQGRALVGQGTMVSQPRGIAARLIAVDTSTLRRLLAGETGEDVDALRDALSGDNVIVPPVVICELLSDPALPPSIAEDLANLPTLEIIEGFWERAGLLRARVLKAGHKAKLADVLIAQLCLDHAIPLITNDRDFRHFTKFGLKIV